jgi:hypothetical protein
MPIWGGICGQCATGGSTGTTFLKYSAVVTAHIAAGTNVTGAGPVPNLDDVLGNYFSVDFEDDVNVYLNGQLLENGPNAGTPDDVYPGTDQTTGDLIFTRKLRIGDVLIMEIFASS